MTSHDIAFTIFAVPTVAAAALALLGRQVVHAALWLVVALAGLAGAYLVLGAEVVALVQVLVYVGAVVVLLLFALMLTRAPIGPRADLDASPRRRLLAAVAGAAVAVLVGATLLVAVGGETVRIDPANGGPSAVGEAIFAGWLLPFELLSFLLLAALVGALAVSGALRGPDGPSWTVLRRARDLLPAGLSKGSTRGDVQPQADAGEASHDGGEEMLS